MNRIFVTVDETDPSKPVVSIHMNHHELKLSEVEVNGLLGELGWAMGCLSEARKAKWKNLRNIYGRNFDA